MRSCQLFMICFVLMSCNQQEKVAALLPLRCDSLVYSLNRNSQSIAFIDSTLQDENIDFCSIKFSEFNDTATVLFIIGDTGQYSQKSNRFLQIKQRKFCILSGEDFFMREQESNRSGTKDPNYIGIRMLIPGFDIVDAWRFPPVGGR